MSPNRIAAILIGVGIMAGLQQIVCPNVACASVVTRFVLGLDSARAAEKYNKGTMRFFVLRQDTKVVPNVRFRDGEGKPRELMEWRGRVVLLNVWATWCAPCREEMPALDKLQAELGDRQFEVVAVSVDERGPAAVSKFLKELNATNLNHYIDRSGEIGRELRVMGLPMTLLINRKGEEIGWYPGALEWDSSDAFELIGAAKEGLL